MLSVGLKKNSILADNLAFSKRSNKIGLTNNELGTIVKVGVSDFGLEGNYTQSASPAKDLETDITANPNRDLDVSIKDGNVKISSTKEVKETEKEKKTFFTPIVMVVGGLVIIAAGIYFLG